MQSDPLDSFLLLFDCSAVSCGIVDPTAVDIATIFILTSVFFVVCLFFFLLFSSDGLYNGTWGRRSGSLLTLRQRTLNENRFGEN